MIKKGVKKVLAVLLIMAMLTGSFIAQTSASITVFSQLDSRWANHKYGYSDYDGKTQAYIGPSGCGILALVNAIYYLNGRFIEPTTLADFSVANGCRVNGQGTASGSLCKKFGNAHGAAYGFSYAGSTSSLSDMKNKMQGGYVAVGGSETLATGNGHVMAVVDYNPSTDKFLILDSYISSNRFGDNYSWQTLSSSFRTGNGKVDFSSFSLLKNEVNPVNPTETFTQDSAYPTPISAYPAATSGIITVYNSSLAAYSTSVRYIAWNDLCTINAVYTNGYCSVTYPTSGGTNTEYAKKSDFFPNAVTPYSWSPSHNLTTYTRSNMSTPFGSAFTTDSCKVVGKSGNLLQLIYPVSSGYKLGWVNSSYTPITPEEERPSTVIPGPVASGVFSGKTIVAVAPQQITFSGSSYISKGDVCKLYNVNASSGYCTVDYPAAGATDVFTASTVKTQTVAINEFINYNGSAQAETTIIPNQLTAYPTQAMTSTVGSYISNWWLDPGDTYTTINTSSSGATEVLYYCTQGNHAGCWKLGWVWLDYYYLDLNGYLDNSSQGGLNGYGTADIYVNGIKRADDVTNFYSNYPKGSTYEIKDIKAYNGYTYNGVYSGSTSGTLTAEAKTALNFTKNPVTCSSISVTQNPTKLTYLEGDSLNTSGLIVNANFSDGSNRNVTSSCSFSGYSSTPGTKTITVSYSGKATAFSVLVNSKSPTAISITTNPTKTTYLVGDAIDFSGLVVKATYNNGTSSTIVDFDSIFEDDITASTGTKTILLSYTHNDITKTASFSIIVNSPPVNLQSIAVTPPAKLIYEIGESLNTNGMVVTATYSDNSTSTVSISDCTLSGFNSTTAGIRTVTVTYGGQSASFNVSVVNSTPDPDAPQLVVSNPRGTAGSTVDVTVSLQNNPGIMAARYSINYDNSKLELISVTDGGLMGASLFDPGNVLTDVPYSVCWNDAGTTNYSEDGVMVTFKFRILDETAVGTTPVTLTIDQGSTFNSNLESVVFATVNGTVEITDRTPGDANGDTEIDLKDVVIIRRYLAGGWNVTLDASSADVNGDNSVDLKDVVLVRRYLAGGWGVVLL